MTHHPMFPGSLLCLAIAMAMTGCASNSPITPQGAATGVDCRQLGAEIATAQDAKRAAQDRKDNAWKAVIPVAVVAKVAQGAKETADATRRIEQLQASAARQGC